MCHSCSHFCYIVVKLCPSRSLCFFVFRSPRLTHLRALIATHFVFLLIFLSPTYTVHLSIISLLFSYTAQHSVPSILSPPLTRLPVKSFSLLLLALLPDTIFSTYSYEALLTRSRFSLLPRPLSPLLSPPSRSVSPLFSLLSNCISLSPLLFFHLLFVRSLPHMLAVLSPATTAISPAVAALSIHFPL